MPNIFSDAYDPIFYAQEAITQIEQAMGMSARVYRGLDEEKKSATRGSTIRVRKPSTFVVTEGGAGTFQDLDTDGLDMVVDNWKEVKFKLTDKELALHPDTIISDHIRPAAYAIANYVNSQVGLLSRDIPWRVDMGATISDEDIINPRGVLRQNLGDILDTSMLHYGIDDVVESKFLGLDIFKTASTTGQGMNSTLYNASLGTRYRVETFVDQTLPVHVGGSLVASADTAGALSADALKGATTVSLAGFTGDVTLKKGDSFVIAGNAQRYVVEADASLTAGAGTVSVYPKLVQGYASGSVVTFDANTTAAPKYSTNLMFHPNAFALAFAPLPEVGNNLGAKMATITDPKTKISIRSRVAYYDQNATVAVTLDVLFGCKTINDKYACVVRRGIA